MSTLSNTEASSETLSSFSESDPFVRNTQVQEDRCHAYDVCYAKTGVAREQRAFSGKVSSGKGEQEQASPEQRYVLTQYLETARREAAAMENAASSDEPFELASAAIGLTEALRELWRLRSLRSEPWLEILNFVQCSLGQGPFEHLERQQCQAISEILERYLEPDANSDDVQATLVRLENAGFDPWRGISWPDKHE